MKAQNMVAPNARTIMNERSVQVFQYATGEGGPKRTEGKDMVPKAKEPKAAE